MRQYQILQKKHGELLNIVGYPEVGEPFMLGKGMYFSVFYCFYYVKDKSTDMLEDQVLEQRYLDLNEEEDIILDTMREENCRDIAE